MLKQKLALPLFALLGLVVTVAILLGQPDMTHNPQAAKVTDVKTITIPHTTLRPQIRGYGVVEPEVLLKVVSEISGRVVYIHPQLRKGNLLSANTTVIRIDERDHQLALHQAEAELASTQASLRELTINSDDANKNLALAKEKLILANREYQRAQKLFAQGLTSQNALDAERSRQLQLEQEVQNLNNKVDVLPSQQQVLKARLAIAQAKLETQKRNLQRTELRLPFDARIDELYVEEDQFVTLGNTLFAAQDTSKVLINAQFAPDHFQIIARGFAQQQTLLNTAFQQHDSTRLFENLDLHASVRLANGHGSKQQNSTEPVQWQGRVERISNTLDPQTRTLGIVISVSNPYQQIQPGIKPPLLTGMYTEVLLSGPADQFYVVPRSALHESHLYILNDKQELEVLPIAPLHQQNKIALFSGGLNDNQQLIVTDIFPAIPGMKLQATVDHSLEQQLLQWIEGAQ